MLHGDNKAWIQFPERTFYRLICVDAFSDNAHAGGRTRVTNMGGLYVAATLCALLHCMRAPPQALEFQAGRVSQKREPQHSRNAMTQH